MNRYFKNPFDQWHENQTVEFNENDVAALIHSYVSKILRHTKPKSAHEKDRRVDLYVGDSGIAFMFWKLAQSEKFKNGFPAMDLAKTYLECAKHNLKNTSLEKEFGFLNGSAGVYCLSAVHSATLNNTEEQEKSIKKYLKGVSHFKKIDSETTQISSEFLIGRAGFICGIMWMREQIDQEIAPDNDYMELLESLYQSGRNYADENQLNVPLMYNFHGREYIGAAHGISFILLIFLQSPWFQDYPDKHDQNLTTKINNIKKTIDEILNIQTSDGNFPSKFSATESHLVHWCHGAPGVVYLMAKAYMVFKENKYLDACLKAGDLVWEKGLLQKGPGICHGVAGNAYIFLLLYRLTNDEKHLYRASKFMEFLTSEKFLREARTPDRPYSLFEGLAGTVCFLLDLMEPNKACFPFMNIFD